MKRFLSAVIVLMAASTIPAFASDIGLSISIGQPGFYGRIDIGNAPPPLLVYPEPVVILPPPKRTTVRPIYLHVPPGHAKSWKKHCGKYNACGQPVYFVRDEWYNDVYVPHYRKNKNGHGKGRGEEHGRAERRGRDRD